MWYESEETEEAENKMKRCIDECVKFDAPIMVAHPFIGFDDIMTFELAISKERDEKGGTNYSNMEFEEYVKKIYEKAQKVAERKRCYVAVNVLEKERETYIKLYGNESMTEKIGQDNKKVIANLEANHTYYLQFSGFMMRYAKGSIAVTPAHVLEFKKDTDSSFIYVNNPEYITKWDIVDEPSIIGDYVGETYRTWLKIFEQKNVYGQNTYYQTHLSWFSYPEKKQGLSNTRQFLCRSRLL